jgi:hypothetical protein
LLLLFFTLLIFPRFFFVLKLLQDPWHLLFDLIEFTFNDFYGSINLALPLGFLAVHRRLIDSLDNSILKHYFI